MVQNDDEAWRAIVDNYGDRADLDDPPEAASQTPERQPRTSPPLADDPEPDDVHGWERASEASAPTGWEDEDRFVPPPPPPIPTTTTDRMAAWVGIFGSPLVLLVALVLGIRLPELISYVLVLGFVGGFLYLVLKMNREPRDPGDNGAVL
ncbi:hypothetical protein [Nocardioides sp.]|uniref:hypothetical protein n=1 Tax=Nocardioides sp. TaxID=35761 RepID=UPI002B269D89|nr:hypothetical protein [Nocardioides sp.]